MPRLAVVVCSYNGASRIGACVDALRAQTCTDFELVVVDDGSVDGTAACAQAHGATVVRLPVNSGLSAARNAGVRATSAPLVAFTDDDCVPPPNWVAGLLAAWDRVGAGVVAVGGHVRPLDLDSFNRRYVGAIEPLAPLELSLAGKRSLTGRLALYLAQPVPESSERFVFSLVGANMSFRRGALEDVGGFDPVIRFGGDEEAVCIKLRAEFGDHCLWVDPSVLVLHDFDRSLRDTLRRSRSYGAGAGREFARHGGLPAVRPVPFFAVAAFVAALPLGRKWALSAALAVPYAVFRRHAVRALSTRSVEPLAYPLVAAAQEVCANAGFVQGWWRTRRQGHGRS